MPLQFDRMSEREDGLRRAGYRQLEPFYVLREGDIKDERTGGVVKLDRNRLMKIAAIQNNRILETGDFTPIIIGHTKKGKLETEQPELIGKASRFEVVPFFETGTWGLRAVPWTKPQNVELYEKYPRRSAELWTNPDLLDPISLLGANTPRLDLGLHRLSRELDAEIEFYVPKHGRSGVPFYFEMDTNMPEHTPEPEPESGTPGSDATAAVFNSPQWKQLEATVNKIAEAIMPLIEEATGGGGAPPNPGGGAPPAGPVPPPGDGGPPQQMSGHPAHAGHPHHGGQPSQQAGHPMHSTHHAGHPMHHAGHPAHAGHPMHHPGHPEHVQHIVSHQPPATHVPIHHGGHPHQYDHGGGGFSPPGGTNSMMPQHLSRDGGYDPRDQMIAELQQRLAAIENQNAQLQLSMIHEHVNGVLDDLEDKIVLNREKDFNRLVRLSRAELDAEVQDMLMTRKPVEQQLPPEGVPLHMQATGRQAGKGPMGPVQMTMSQAHEMLQMQADPTSGGVGGPVEPQPGSYEFLQNIVRNRGRMGNMEAYEQARTAVMGKLNGQASVRG